MIKRGNNSCIPAVVAEYLDAVIELNESPNKNCSQRYEKLAAMLAAKAAAARSCDVVDAASADLAEKQRQDVLEVAQGGSSSLTLMIDEDEARHPHVALLLKFRQAELALAKARVQEEKFRAMAEFESARADLAAYHGDAHLETLCRASAQRFVHALALWEQIVRSGARDHSAMARMGELMVAASDTSALATKADLYNLHVAAMAPPNSVLWIGRVALIAAVCCALFAVVVAVVLKW